MPHRGLKFANALASCELCLGATFIASVDT